MARAGSIYDKPATELDAREIEVEKLRLEAERARAESSFGRRYGTIILSAMLTLAGTAITWYVNERADVRAQQAKQAADERSVAASAEETARNLAQNAVRLYFDHPERFDLNSEEGQFNLRVLAATAPGETTQTLLNRVQARSVNEAVAKASAAEAATAPAANAPAVAMGGAPAPAAAPANPTQPTSQAVQQVADNARYAAIQKAPSIIENASKPSDFMVYVQYGYGAQDRALSVQKRLKDMGYGAPGIDAVKIALGQPEVRYYRTGQEKLARQVADGLTPVIGVTPAVKYIGEGRTLPDGVMEVWLPPTVLLQENIRRANSAIKGLRDSSSFQK